MELIFDMVMIVPAWHENWYEKDCKPQYKNQTGHAYPLVWTVANPYDDITAT